LQVLRFFSGIGGSAPLAIGGGILADCFHPEQRGKAIAIYSLAPLIGPAAGPVAGGFIAQNISWRWVFWIVTIADAVVQVFGIFFLQETWAPKLIEQKAKKMRQATGNEKLYAEFSSNLTLIKKLETSLARPFRLLFTQPIIIALAVYMAYLYGLVYLVISSFAALYTSPDYYGQSTQIAGLHYIALAIGYFIGSQITARLNDWLYRRLKKRAGGVGRPEFRIPVMIPCAILLPAGLFWYGWSAEARAHWILPDIGACLLAGATITGYYAIQTYVIDAYTKYAASAVASITFLRSLAGFAFPLFAPNLYEALHYGWGNSVLAFVAIALGVPSPILFWKYGAKLRAMSQFAAGQG
jgi:MFS family permease